MVKVKDWIDFSNFITNFLTTNFDTWSLEIRILILKYQNFNNEDEDSDKEKESSQKWEKESKEEFEG